MSTTREESKINCGGIESIIEGERFEHKLKVRNGMWWLKREYVNPWFCTFSTILYDLSDLDRLFEKGSFENVSTDLSNPKITRPDIYGFAKDTYKASDNFLGYDEGTRVGHRGRHALTPLMEARFKKWVKRREKEMRQRIDDLWEA